MKKGLIIGLVIAVVILGALAFYLMKSPAPVQKTSGTDLGQGTVSGQGSIVSIKSFNFNPTTVNIRVGETVTWNNEDSASHQIISDSGSEISSDSLSKGQSYSHTFNTAGIYDYHCSIHASMKGKVVVS
jgi:amicyanin